MNNIAIIEILLIGTIIVIQTIVGSKTLNKIKNLKRIITNTDNLQINEAIISLSDLKHLHPKKILENIFNTENDTTIVKLEESIATKKESLKSLNEKKTSLEEAKEIYDEVFSIESVFKAEVDAFHEEDNLTKSIELLETEIEEEEAKLTNLKDKESLENSEKVSLIDSSSTPSKVFKNILDSINVYLLRNKGAATDFNLIKDITNRNIEIEEDEVSRSITLPLYLGLMGTMLGIVFGLISMFFTSTSSDNFEVTGFISGVSIAMFASLYGLGWTVFNSSFRHKQAVKTLENRKNDFFTFIQIELLPLINQSVSSSVYDLHQNLVQFNDDFTSNINHLKGLLVKNYDALIAQDNILQALEHIDITSFAKANVLVLRELKESTLYLQRFNKYLNSLESISGNTLQLSGSFQTLLDRTNNFEHIAEKIDRRVEDSNKLVQFFNNHYEILENKGKILENAVKDVDDVLIKSLNELQTHTNEKIEAIKKITEQEEDNMIKAFAENRSHISKLSLLDELNKVVHEIKKQPNKEVLSINETLKELKKGVDTTNKLLQRKHDGLIVSNLKKIGLFKSKKKNEK